MFKLIKNCRFAILFLSVFLFTIPCPDQNAQAQQVTNIPFNYDGRILIPVNVNDAREFRIILDTGAPGNGILLVHSELGEESGLSYVSERSLGGGGGNDAPLKAGIATGVKLTVGGIDFTERPATVILQSRKESIHHNEGVIGGTIFTPYVVEIDFDKNEVILYEPETFIIKSGWTEIPLIIERNVPHIETEITLGSQTVPVKLFVDIGASTTLSLSLDEEKNILLPGHSVYTLGGTGIRGDVYADHGRIAELKIGGLSLSRVVSNFADRKDVPNFGPIPCDGLLGIGVFHKFNMIFDYSKSKMYVKRNRHYDTPFEYNMAGLVIKDKYDGSKIIHYIIENSIASKKGLKIGDEIVSVDGRGIQDFDFFEFRKAFTNEGKTIRLRIKRNSEIIECSLPLKRIL